MARPSSPQMGDAVGLFLGLYLGHILGDFVFQPGRLVIAKREHQTATMLHSGIVAACSGLALAGVLAEAWPAVVAAGLAHLAVEQLSIHARRNPSSTGLTVFVLDQALHVVSLGLIAALLGLEVPAVLFIWPADAALVARAAAVATVAFGGSILVFEVHMARAGRAEGTSPVLGMDLHRVYGMAERSAALLLALVLPFPALGALAFAPRLAYALAHDGQERSHHLTAGGVGLGLAAVAWLLVSTTIGPTG